MFDQAIGPTHVFLPHSHLLFCIAQEAIAGSKILVLSRVTIIIRGKSEMGGRRQGTLAVAHPPPFPGVGWPTAGQSSAVHAHTHISDLTAP